MLTINNTRIHEAAITHEMQYHPAATQDEARNKACESLVIGELLKQRAAALGLLNATAERGEEYLDALIEREISIPEASQEDCQRYYQQNPNKFCTTPLLEGRHILLAVAPEDDAGRSQARDQAAVLIAALQQDPEMFGSFAKQYSRCPSAEVGGSLGQIGKGQTVPEFERQLFTLPEGLASAPIESRYGIHIVLIAHREEGRQLPFDMVETRIRDYLNEKVRRKAIAQYIEALINDAEIEGFDFQVSGSPLMQ
jgi:peptidyl-prolyl cis-trans isomerase C